MRDNVPVILVTAALLLSGAHIAAAQQGPPSGKWHSTYKAGNVAVDDTLVLSPDGKFEETESGIKQGTNITTVVSGSYTVSAGNVMHLAPAKWSANLGPPSVKLPTVDMHYQITSPTVWTESQTNISGPKPVTITETWQRVQ